MRSFSICASKMAIADLIGQGNEMSGIPATNLRQWFRQGQHFDDTAILQHQPVAMAQRLRLFKIKQEGKPAIGLHHHAAAVPRRMIQRNGFIGPVHLRAGGANLRCAQHLRTGNSAAPSAAPLRVHRSEARHRRALHRFPDSPRSSASRHYAPWRILKWCPAY